MGLGFRWLEDAGGEAGGIDFKRIAPGERAGARRPWFVDAAS